ncbi:MAG: S41 family peptidase [Alphaproteobacteria bacterium]|nr:S41 family peptidase [Alphaproteobacteria bacterium]
MRRILQSFVVVGAAFAGGLLAGVTVANGAWAQGRQVYPALDTLARAMATIESRHVEPVTSDELVHDAIRGMVDGLDPHSRFLSPREYEEMQGRTEGRWFGVGLEMVGHADGVLVQRVIPGSPAALAGVLDGDIVRAVDGTDVGGMSLSEIGELLRGDRGTPVVLGLTRDGGATELTVVRDQVIAPTVTAALFSPGRGYARIEHFRQRTGAELAQALSTLEAEGGQPLTGLVLDLRENPGGLLDEAVAVVDLFVGEQLVVETHMRGGEVEDRLSATTDAGDRDLKLVVLIDGRSASASEIVAGALQVMDRATIVGTRSYGKGSVQQVWEFEDGSALKLTIANYHLPDGRTITHDVGVVPDVVVPRPDDQSFDAVLDGVEGLSDAQRAALRSGLEPLLIPPDPLEGPTVDWTGSLDERRARDPQLERAWRILAGS